MRRLGVKNLTASCNKGDKLKMSLPHLAHSDWMAEWAEPAHKVIGPGNLKKVALPGCRGQAETPSTWKLSVPKRTVPKRDVPRPSVSRPSVWCSSTLCQSAVPKQTVFEHSVSKLAMPKREEGPFCEGGRDFGGQGVGSESVCELDAPTSYHQMRSRHVA